MTPNTDLPERVLQFGTGILLRGLPDYFIDKANRQNLFLGRILVVKSTPGDIPAFGAQDGQFLTRVRGLENGNVVEADILNTAISRVLQAHGDWDEILRASGNPLLQIIISNTTEVGLVFRDESIFQHPPQSFPAKLTAFLYERFRKLGSNSPRTLVVPTELVPDNGEKLKGIVHQNIAANTTDHHFAPWLEQKVIFCNSLVDRIVTRPPGTAADSSAIQVEPYRLWAIEGDEEVKRIMTFAAADDGVVITPNIDYYRERKLRLLNGTHTIGVCLGFLEGHRTVLDCMRHEETRTFFEEVMMTEILPTLPIGTIEENTRFGREVLDRFANPFADHRLLSITLQATAKMKMRNIPTILRYAARFGKTPPLLAKGFAAYLQFVRPAKKEGSQWYGQWGSETYPIVDDAAGYFFQRWKNHAAAGVAKTVCADTSLWEANLNEVPGFTDAVARHLTAFNLRQNI
jgi:tagaturonate reductase